MKRVYVPTTLAVWQRLVANGSMFQVSGTAFAVTPGESYAEQHNAQSTCSSKACSVARYKGELRTSPGLAPGERGSCVVTAKLALSWENSVAEVGSSTS